MDPSERIGADVTRRQLMQRLGMIGAGAFVSGTALNWAAGPSWAGTIERAAQINPAGSDLGAVEHIVYLMLENRSYDHYFGAYPKGRGFDDHPGGSLGNFAQDFPGRAGGDKVAPKGKLLPWHLNSKAGFECTDDLTHDWGPMHECWNGGKMDSWVKVHTEPAWEGDRGVLTMGYYTREDLPFHWALADNFTLCDNYHASILGPTHPNRLMAISGTIDPAGQQGGPIVATNIATQPDVQWACTWQTMPEVLQDAGISWKVYSPSNVGVGGQYAALAKYPTWSPGLYDPTTTSSILGLGDNVLPYFKNFVDTSSPLFNLAFQQTFPNRFVSDVAAGTLPSVSWIVPPLGFDEHPAASPMNGQYFTSLVLGALVSNPEVWSKTAFFIMYDENDGWFDHVTPPTAPKGTPGEWLTTSRFPTGEKDPDTGGIKGPLGLGVRVPGLMVSPFSRGGNIASGLFDHTSQLQLIAERFDVAVPNVSAWRKKTVGDLTSTMFQAKTNTSVPALPKVSVLMPLLGYCSAINQDTDAGKGAAPQTLLQLKPEAMYPTKQRMPNQNGGTDPASKYFKLTREEAAIADDDHTPVGGEGKATPKSSFNKLFSEAAAKQ
jgi:phospholipase C